MCKVKHCRNGHGKKKGGLCDKHSAQWFKHKHRRRWAFNDLKGRAKRRGLAFDLTFDYYCGITDGAGYHEGRSTLERGESLTVDRIDITRGYEHGNIRVITHSENVAAANRERFLPETVRALLERRRAAAGACAELLDAPEDTEGTGEWDDGINPF